MAYSFLGGGNPRYGRDANGTGPPGLGGGSAPRPWPGSVPFQQPPPVSAYAYQPPPYWGVPSFPSFPSFPAMGAPPFPAGGGTPFPPPARGPGAVQGGAAPRDQRAFRSCNMRNTTGGFGCEPGYNYFFPTEHTKILELETGATPPWQLPPNFAISFHAYHVPVNTTVGELLKGLGAKNPVPKKNALTEVCQGGGGKWYRGIEVRGDQADLLKKPIKELGWDASRTGLRGEKNVVYVYVRG